MAVDLNDLKSVFQEFLDSSKAALLEVQEQTQMEDEYFATAVAQIISNAMSSSIQALDIISGIAIKTAQSTKDLLIKDQQELAEKIKNGGVSITHTYDEDGNVLTTTYGTGTSKSIHELQKELVEKQILDTISSTTVRNQLKDSDLSIKAQQELAEKIKNGGVSITHTYDEDGNVLTTTYGTGTSKSIHGAQIDLSLRQTLALDDAKKVKKAQILGEAIAMIQSGGITPPAQMQTDFNIAIAAV